MFRIALLPLLLGLLAACIPLRLEAQLPGGRQKKDIPSRSWVLPGCSADSVKTLVETSPSRRIHGIWSATADGAVIALIPGDLPSGGASPAALMVVLRSPSAAFRCGTVCGWLIPTARAGVFDARIFTSRSGMDLTEPRKFTVTMLDADRLEFVPRKTRLEFRPLRMLPFMYRIPLSIRSSREEEPRDGLTRVWPAPSVSPSVPRYL